MDPIAKCKSPSPNYAIYQREIYVEGAKGFGMSFHGSFFFGRL